MPPTHCIFKPTDQKINAQSFISFNLRQVFIDNFNQKKDAISSFLLKLSDSITRSAVQQFQFYVTEITSNMKYVCTSYAIFIPVTEIIQLQYIDLTFQRSIRSNIFLEKGLDICRQYSNNSYFCQNCVNSIWRFKPPQFSCISSINTYTCQSYPKVPKDFFLIEKSIIAYAHSIISIIILIPLGNKTFIFYLLIFG